MTKKEIVSAIIKKADIYHNISINFSKMPYFTSNDVENGFDWGIRPENDLGNRNLCGCKDNKNINGACRKHDIWHFYTHGRSGATFYWDKYWDSANSGFSFKHHEHELEDLSVFDLREMLKEITAFSKSVSELMKYFYAGCREEWKQVRDDMVKKQKLEVLYLKTLKVVKDNDFGKRLITDLL